MESDSPTLALGTKVFSRDDDLRELLDTLPDTLFDAVYIADDGPESDSRDEIYNQYDVELIDLEYDAGLGAGRNAIIERCDEEYLCVVDTDHRVPSNVTTLVDQLEADSSLGGVGGALVRPDEDLIRFVGLDFGEENNDRVLSVSPFHVDKTVEMIAGSPLVRFDFIPNAAVFRRSMLEDYPWDDFYVIEGEHEDFYLNHWHNSDWEFGLSPSVYFAHYHGGDAEYEAERRSPEKETASWSYFRRKWEYDQVDRDRWDWVAVSGLRSEHLTKLENARRVIREEGVPGLVTTVSRVARRMVNTI